MKKSNDDKPKKQGKAELIDWYKKIPKKYLLKTHNPNFNLHGIKVPFRMLIIGNSGSGKTQTLLNLMHNFGATFQNIAIITKNKHEPLYEYLEDKTKDQGLTITEGIAGLPDLDKFNKEEQTLIVLDDLVLEKQQGKIEEYFIRARKLNCSVIYISKSYFLVPKIIRQNLSYLIVKQVSSFRDLKLIMSEYSLGIDKVQLKDIYETSTAEKQDFLLVDLEAPPKDRFRKNFTEIFDIDEDEGGGVGCFGK
jgi:ABC-type dipeptide/oligopeptide/nickel transport system ATPase component